MKYQSFETPRCKIFVSMQDTTRISKEKCIYCKGRLLCGLPTCPIFEQVKIQSSVKLSDHFFGPSPSVFVGWQNYPRVYAGPLSLNFEPDDSLMYDNPKKWYGYDFPQIVDMRSSLIRSKKKGNVTTPSEDIQLLALAKTPPDIEVTLKKKPTFTIVFSAIAQPMGPSGFIKKLEIADNVSAEKSVEYTISDELKAQDALWKLYTSGIDVYALSRVMSAGLLGAKKKMVPTRWSITSVDNILGNKLIEEIKELPLLNEYTVFSNEYLGNHFEILFLPQRWEYEQLEAWVPNTFWTVGMTETRIIGEHETYTGRSDYAIREGGGYYAVRLACLEKLQELKKQGAVLVFRETTPEYFLCVGVWECRENVRNAPKVSEFSTLEAALQDISSRLHIPTEKWKEKSVILSQTKLDKWIK
ncbi:MAG: hypothetical protein HXS46_16085 [Theionarchaea archaeon]|nr:MAG: hypothetical protein AYK18_03045 [Theionarchaea archaeon DG-70]MBU7012206.1 hypothetical protein [Theionarchaea archaeon]